LTRVVVLYRVDERLIHGQVVVGWGARLRPARIVVVDDAVAASLWEQELYAMGVPPEVEAEFVSVEGAVDKLPDWQAGGERVILLTRDVETMSQLARSGLLSGVEVNIGGIHHAPGRTRVLRYVFLSDAERRDLEELAGQGTEIVARDLPSARGVGLDELVRVP
jgi:PTS system mannose-specific IIB component/fructoselysine and glucoselysine-specific PTS system IIB component